MAKFIAADYSGIEAVLTGWFMRDAAYIRLARLGVHAYLTSHLVGDPASLQWSDSDLIGFFAEMKEGHPDTYDKAKRAVHGYNYGLTVHGLCERFPDLYPTKAAAQHVVAVYTTICPKLPAFQKSVIDYAAANHFWGGPGLHPYNLKHYFYNIVNYKPLTEAAAQWHRREGYKVIRIDGRPFARVYGDDSKRALAFPAQSTACGVIKEAGLRLYAPPEISGFGENYIGDWWYGDTPLRALVHDEFLSEVRDRDQDRAIERIVREMRRPVLALPLDPSWWPGEERYLSIGVEVNVGQCWAKKKMEKIDISGIAVPGSPWAETRETDDDEREFLREIREELALVETDEEGLEIAPEMRTALVG